MNKLTKKQYIRLIADAMTYEYGSTLMEYDTDIKMATTVLKEMRKYLYFKAENARSTREFNQWKKERLEEEE